MRGWDGMGGGGGGVAVKALLQTANFTLGPDAKNSVHTKALHKLIVKERKLSIAINFNYRLKLNKESTVKIAATDPDDDYVKCGESLFVESGVFAEAAPKLPGVTIEEVSNLPLVLYNPNIRTP